MGSDGSPPHGPLSSGAAAGYGDHDRSGTRRVLERDAEPTDADDIVDSTSPHLVDDPAPQHDNDDDNASTFDDPGRS